MSVIHGTGRIGEYHAAQYLEHRGYTILGRNVHVGPDELDIIAHRDGLLAFVEVKTRTNGRFGDGAEAIDERKIRRMRRAAIRWFAGQEHYWPEVTFDAIVVTPIADEWACEHIEQVC